MDLAELMDFEFSDPSKTKKNELRDYLKPAARQFFAKHGRPATLILDNCNA